MYSNSPKFCRLLFFLRIISKIWNLPFSSHSGIPIFFPTDSTGNFPLWNKCNQVVFVVQVASLGKNASLSRSKKVSTRFMARGNLKKETVCHLGRRFDGGLPVNLLAEKVERKPQKMEKHLLLCVDLLSHQSTAATKKQ